MRPHDDHPVDGCETWPDTSTDGAAEGAACGSAGPERSLFLVVAVENSR